MNVSDLGLAGVVLNRFIQALKTFPPYTQLPDEWRKWVTLVLSILVGALVCYVGQVDFVPTMTIEPAGRYLVTGVGIAFIANGYSFFADIFSLFKSQLVARVQAAPEKVLTKG